ncbi:TPA: protein disulfide oxidoreductase [Providencia rettgeri]
MNKLKKWSKEIIVLAIILFIAFTVMDLWRKPQALAPVLLEQHTLVNGETVSLAELSKEKPILVYFWATWCGVCNLTSPTVSDLSQSGMAIISVAIRSGETPRLIKGMESKDLTFPVINDISGQLSNAVGVSATPTFMVIDNGELVSFTSGWTSSYGLKMRMWLASF